MPLSNYTKKILTIMKLMTTFFLEYDFYFVSIIIIIIIVYLVPYIHMYYSSFLIKNFLFFSEIFY